MLIITCCIDDDSARILRLFARRSGQTVEEVAELAIAEITRTAALTDPALRPPQLVAPSLHAEGLTHGR